MIFAHAVSGQQVTLPGESFTSRIGDWLSRWYIAIPVVLIIGFALILLALVLLVRYTSWFQTLNSPKGEN